MNESDNNRHECKCQATTVQKYTTQCTLFEKKGWKYVTEPYVELILQHKNQHIKLQKN